MKPMFYIQQMNCISPQHSFKSILENEIVSPKNNKLNAIEPSYNLIPPNQLRRMGTALRMGIGAALPLLQYTINGIVMGTAKGGMEDSIKFINQIIEYNEGVLAPNNFVQSTTNAIAGNLALFNKNNGYNITHTHHGLAFENAMIDVAMLLQENMEHNYLLGGVDEISSYNYNTERLAGAYKKIEINKDNFYITKTAGSIAGEGSNMFLVNKNKNNSLGCVQQIITLHSQHINEVINCFKNFIQQNFNQPSEIDLFLSGENGDSRILPFYESCKAEMSNDTAFCRFKHLCGEYPTAISFGLWYGVNILQKQIFANQIQNINRAIKNIIIYNCVNGVQHSFICLKK